MVKRLHNPIVGDTLEVITEGKDTNGVYHLIQASIPKNSPGPVPHYHTGFSEEFTVLEGQLHILDGKKEIVLTKGQSFLAEKGKVHTFRTTGTDTKFLCKVSPACEGQYLAALIASNLVKAGLTNKKGIPTNLWHLAALLDIGESRLTGLYSIIGGLLAQLAKTGKGKRTRSHLLKTYAVWETDLNHKNNY